jgi:uncharacterized protein with HEPN domain
MTRNIGIYIKDILTNMDYAESFISGMSPEVFAKDTKTSYAVARCIEIIGEAAKNIPDRVRHKHPDIPWKEMAGMRDKVIHLYFGVDPQKVWLVVKERIPHIRPLLLKVLTNLQGQ